MKLTLSNIKRTQHNQSGIIFGAEPLTQCINPLSNPLNAVLEFYYLMQLYIEMEISETTTNI